jgi:hypothetical protein
VLLLLALLLCYLPLHTRSSLSGYSGWLRIGGPVEIGEEKPKSFGKFNFNLQPQRRISLPELKKVQFYRSATRSSADLKKIGSDIFRCSPIRHSK